MYMLNKKALKIRIQNENVINYKTTTYRNVSFSLRYINYLTLEEAPDVKSHDIHAKISANLIANLSANLSYCGF